MIKFETCAIFWNKTCCRIQLGNQVEVDPEEIHVTFEDVKGVDEAKQELKDVVEFLKNPDKFSNLGGKLPKGVLLVGPPGRDCNIFTMNSLEIYMIVSYAK